MEQVAFGVACGIIIAIITVSAKGLFKSKTDAQQDEIIELRSGLKVHVDACNLVPKSTILEKINGVEKQMNGLAMQFADHAKHDSETAREIFTELRTMHKNTASVALSQEQTNIHLQRIVELFDK